MKFVKIILSLILIISAGYVSEIRASEFHESEGRLIISSLGFSDVGVLSLKVSIELNEEKTLYNWRGRGEGHIYPLYGGALFSDIKLKGPGEVRAERFEKVMPKWPHPLDVVVTDNFEYPEPLLLKILKKDGSSYVGCLDFTLIYDTRQIKSPVSTLSLITLRSNTITVCNNMSEK